MTHRERLLAAVSHEQPDIVPIDLGATIESSIVIEGYERLKDHFGVKAENIYCNRMMRVVRVDESILQKLDIDTRSIVPGLAQNNIAGVSGPRRYVDVWGVERIHPEDSYYYDQLNYPLAGNITVSDIINHDWPDPDDPAWLDGIADRLKWIRAKTDCAAVLTLPAPFVHISQYIRGFEDWYCDLAADPQLIEALFDAILEITLHVAKRELAALGKEVDVIICSDDLGTQTGLQVHPDLYRKYIKPRHRTYLQQIHDMSPAKILFHSCGSLVSIIDDLIEIGVDILNPVQTTAVGMDPVYLKEKYGRQMVFWGAMDNQGVLARGSPKDVKKMVEERIEQLGEGGGYVLSSCHNIQPDVSLENTLAMFQHAREYIPSYMK